MKLFELRDFLKTYEQTWSVRKLVSGDHQEVKSIRLYLQEFDNKPGDYPFNESDVFKLLKRIPLLSDLEIITSIKRKLGSPNFFEIFAGLSRVGLVNEQNFPIFYNLSADGHDFLYALFCCSPTEQITLSAEVFAATIAMTFRMKSSRKKLEQCLKLLNSKQLLTPAALNLLAHYAAEAFQLFAVLEELVQANCLNDTTMGYLTTQNLGNLDSVCTILGLLKRAQITIDNELVKAICANNTFVYLLETLDILIAAEDKFLNKDDVLMLLQQSEQFFTAKKDIFKLLQQHAMLNKKRFDFICTQDDPEFGRILEIVSTKLSISKNQELVDHMVNGYVNPCRLYQVIRYLNKANLLDQTSVTKSVHLVLLKPQKKKCTNDIIDLFNLLFEHNIQIKQEQLILFFQFETNAPRLYRILLDLHANHLLNPDTFEKACERVTRKIPKMPELAAYEISPKQTNPARSELVIDNTTHVFVARDTPSRDNSGGYGVINKGYDTAEGTTPCYSIKRLKESHHAKASLTAAREVKYHRLLGRNAFYFSTGETTSIMSRWLNQKALDLFTAREIKSTPFKIRLRCLIDGLSGLNILHQNYRVHGDIKSPNFIVDFNNATMSLIDFGTTHKRGSTKSFAYTPKYLDSQNSGDHFYKDLYAMGKVIEEIFPEYRTTHDIIFGQAIAELIKSMMLPQGNARCTSADALAYCEALLVNVNNLDMAKLCEIANATIYRNNLTSEDILREKISVNYSP